MRACFFLFGWLYSLYPVKLSLFDSPTVFREIALAQAFPVFTWPRKQIDAGIPVIFPDSRGSRISSGGTWRAQANRFSG
jgi:hypothetical protein